MLQIAVSTDLYTSASGVFGKQLTGALLVLVIQELNGLKLSRGYDSSGKHLYSKTDQVHLGVGSPA